MEALACLDLAEDALFQGKPAYAKHLLERAAVAGGHTPYYTQETERRWLLLCWQAGEHILENRLPDLTPELLLRAAAALADGDGAACARILDGMPGEDAHWHYLRAEAALALGAYAEAVPHYQKAEAAFPRQTLERLEQCFRELEDYKQAYHYSVLQLQMERGETVK